MDGLSLTRSLYLSLPYKVALNFVPLVYHNMTLNTHSHGHYYTDDQINNFQFVIVSLWHRYDTASLSSITL